MLEQEIQPMMILTIDVGNGHVDKLQLYDLNNIEQETYDFCVKNKLDFNTMQEINTQIQNVLKNKQLEEEQEIENVFQEIKEEDDEKITENNINDIREQESIIITNSNEMDTQKENNNDILSDHSKNVIEEKNNKIEKENDDNINNINSNNMKNINSNNSNNINSDNSNNIKNINRNNINNIDNNNNSNNMNNINSNNGNNINLYEKKIKKNNNQSLRTNKSNKSNKSNSSYGNKKSKSKKKNIKDNIREAIAMAKEKTKQNQKSQNRENNSNNNSKMNINNIYENIDNNIDNNINVNNEENNNNVYENNHNEDNNKTNLNQINQEKIEKKENGGIIDKGNNSQKNNIIENYENKNDKNEEIINNEENMKDNNIIKEENNNTENNQNQPNIITEEKKIEENNLSKNELNQENNEYIKNSNEKDNNIDNINNQLNNNINNNEINNSSKEAQVNKRRNKTISHNVSHISSYNPGKELYERGLKFKENEKEKLEALKRNLEVDETEDNTFIPKINKLSEIQIEKIREKGLECTNPYIINNYRQYKLEKMEILKRKNDEEFYRECTFKPRINRSHSSTKIIKNKLNEDYNSIKDRIDANSKIKNESRFDKLYNYRIDYQENKDKLKEKIYNEYSFKPKINENSSFYKLNIPFNERLQTYSNKSKENLIKIQQVYEKELGYEESFQPHLNREKNKALLRDRDEFFINEAQKYNINLGESNKNNLNNNISHIDHYTKLYLYGKKYQQEKNYLTEKYYQNQNKPPQFCESTEEIINRKKEKSFRQIFKLLDGDEDSKISSTHMNISKLPKNISKILEPIFNELKEENETLNELEFIFVCEQLYMSLPWNDKRELTTFEDIAKKNIKKEKILKEKNNFSFKPKINKRNYSFERPTRLNDRVGRHKEIHKNNELNNRDIFNLSQNNYIYNFNNYNNYNNYYYIKKNKINNNINKDNKFKNNMNQINNRVNYFNLKISNQNCDNIKKNHNEYEYINCCNNKGKYAILKNVNINIEGKNSNINEDKKNSNILGRKINYDNFVNVKACS